MSEGISPDLTHFAPNTFAAISTHSAPAQVAADPQGSRATMIIPGAPLTPDEITKLIAYLNTLR